MADKVNFINTVINYGKKWTKFSFHMHVLSQILSFSFLFLSKKKEDIYTKSDDFAQPVA